MVHSRSTARSPATTSPCSHVSDRRGLRLECPAEVVVPSGIRARTMRTAFRYPTGLFCAVAALIASSACGSDDGLPDSSQYETGGRDAAAGTGGRGATSG